MNLTKVYRIEDEKKKKNQKTAKALVYYLMAVTHAINICITTALIFIIFTAFQFKNIKVVSGSQMNALILESGYLLWDILKRDGQKMVQRSNNIGKKMLSTEVQHKVSEMYILSKSHQEENKHANYGQPLNNQQFFMPKPMPAQHKSS